MAKKAVPQESRRSLARRAGLFGPGRIAAWCHWCGAEGAVAWMNRAWVTFPGLEIDHVLPEVLGGSGQPENLVLACRRCNRSRGWRAALKEAV